MLNGEKRRLLRIGELSKITGISTSAINYYIREGILPPPLKTAPNMAYYDPGYVDLINSIKVLKRDKGLGLSEIKEYFKEKEFKWPKGFDGKFIPGKEAIGDGGERFDRRKHIMAVAAGVFSEKGYYATTISDLAQAAGIAKGTIYWYFENKRSIMLAILDELFCEISETFLKVVKTTRNGLDAILECIEPALQLLDRQGHIYLMYFLEIASTDPEIQNKFREIYRSVHEGTKRAIARGIEQGVIRPLNPEIAAYAVMGIIERISQVGTPRKNEIPLSVKAKEAREMIKRSLQAEEGNSPQRKINNKVKEKRRGR